MMGGDLNPICILRLSSFSFIVTAFNDKLIGVFCMAFECVSLASCQLLVLMNIHDGYQCTIS